MRPVVSLALAALSAAAALGCAEDPHAHPRAEGAAASPAAIEAAGAAAATVPRGEDVIAAGSVTGIAPPASGGFPSVVVLEPIAAAPAAIGARPTASPFLDQIGSAFYPQTVVAEVGREIEFLNSEGIMHNVHVADGAGETVFNLATPPGFESYRHALETPGVYRVSCDIHPSMKAFIVATASPFATVADAGGRFAIAGVPPGSYRASVWSVDESRRLTRSVEIGAGGVELDLTRGEG